MRLPPREENPSEILTTSMVFAYCPVQKLSERIQERNRKADIDNPMDKRIGLFPFHQLAKLVTADKVFDDSSEHVLSRNELFYMVNKHANTEKNGDPLFLENPVDLDALQQSDDEDSQIITTSDDSVVKLEINDDTLKLTSDDLPRIGTKKTIEEYSKLANQFGFFKNQERASLNISEGIDFDAVINTAKGNPATLANEFLEKLEKSKISFERVSTL